MSPIVQDDAAGDFIAAIPNCNRFPSAVVLNGRREMNDMTTMTTDRAVPAAADRDLRIGSWLMGAAAVGFIGYAVIFLVRNFTDSFLELGIGPNEVNVGKAAIQNFSPSLFQYISHLQIAVSGFIAATGVAVLFLVAYGVRRGERWAWVGAVTAPVLALLIALPAHYPNHFDTLGHLGLIYLATLIFVAGALLALRGILTLRKG
jgi:multisubunit Na+/H+ antiporter MnhB subunit